MRLFNTKALWRLLLLAVVGTGLSSCDHLRGKRAKVAGVTQQTVPASPYPVPRASDGKVYFPGTIVAQGAPQPLQASFDQSTQVAYADTAYRLGSGDRLRITVFGETGLTGEYLVDGNGNISMPLISQVRLGGMTSAEAQALIAAKLRDGYLRNPDVAVQIIGYRPFFILGEVVKAGQYPYVVGMTIQTAVAIAGGYSPRARKSKVKVTRHTVQGPVRMKLKPTSTVMPGDTIVVEERFF